MFSQFRCPYLSCAPDQMLYLAPRTPLRLNQMARSHTLSHVSDEVCYASMKSCSMEAATSTGVHLSLKLPVNLRTELSHRKLGDGHAVKKAGSRHMTRNVRRTIKSSPKHFIREAQNQKPNESHCLSHATMGPDFQIHHHHCINS